MHTLACWLPPTFILNSCGVVCAEAECLTPPSTILKSYVEMEIEEGLWLCGWVAALQAEGPRFDPQSSQLKGKGSERALTEILRSHFQGE